MTLRELMGNGPDVEIAALAYRSDHVVARGTLLLRPRLQVRRSRLRTRRRRARRRGARLRAAARPRRARADRRRRAGGHGARRGALLRRPDGAAGGCRHHRHQRQDHHRVPGPAPARGRRTPLRPARDRQARGGGPRGGGRAHHARGDRPSGDLPGDARRRRPRLRDGGLLARARAGARERDPVRLPGVHQPDPGPPRLPRDDGGLLPRQAAAVRGPGARRRQRRRRVRAPPRRRGGVRDVRDRARGRLPRVATSSST